jgi:hypothetical protein
LLLSLLFLLNMELNPPWYLLVLLPLWKKLKNVNLGSTLRPMKLFVHKSPSCSTLKKEVSALKKVQMKSPIVLEKFWHVIMHLWFQALCVGFFWLLSLLSSLVLQAWKVAITTINPLSLFLESLFRSYLFVHIL